MLIANSNRGIRRIAKLYKTFSIKYPDLLGFVKRDYSYYLEHKHLYKACWIMFFDKTIICRYCNMHGYWTQTATSPKEFYKVYQIVESWIRDE